ncbi:hypothetical protein [Pseudomonas fluorescens]|jgi:hypothetical protein|uniref:Lipoprotein n=1 Tax=Pseudomonas fluorescens NCIMB 11764 TaxID=1221522 RepID=A0A0K1QWS1_PSEFL|nr:hypothetical protein [Pseudomonas fluorescens]AKV09910.1 hypothetical protein B723_27315 [Pseudomonas fluorescens NCIMB 11764]
MKALYAGSLLLLIAGCAQTPQYTVPANAPQAQIRSEMDVTNNRRNGASLTVAPAMDCKFGRSVAVTPGRQLFSVDNKATSPEGFRAVEAGKPLHLVLQGWASGNRRCTVDFVTEFTPGARYVIKGGIADGPDEIGGCKLSIFDMASGARVIQAKPSQMTNGCALDRLSMPTL